VLVVDGPEAWDAPAFRALDFRAAPEGTPHAFAFACDTTVSALGATFVARAHGDLDGDGVTSTFEARAEASLAIAGGARVVPGMFVDAETE
jgi:hypothetical protein